MEGEGGRGLKLENDYERQEGITIRNTNGADGQDRTDTDFREPRPLVLAPLTARMLFTAGWLFSRRCVV